ncbi:DNA cytosine methyltransferase [Microbacterium paludicola]|uniref:DNA cytosine methyltransferase n=1 Tax=Microbacterium paludicola TaxID=300019 RepID=UPI0011A32273|nr:DNA cytosine methyltransferase [Microbacterium paludicola]
MTGIRSGELFAGVGGLGMAVDEVFGATPAWFAEFDTAPSKVLAHRHPDVPNYGDVTNLSHPERVQILAGGFPCQDVSLAGARRGMKDGTRSGLWSEYARIIDEVRPDWVVIENVRGLISARADSEMERCTWCVGDGDDEYHLRALDAVLADLSRLGFDAEWTGLRAADIGAPHGRFRVFILAWPSARTRDVAGGEVRTREGSAFGGKSADLTLLPTPVAQPSGNTPEDHLRKKPGREVVTDLAIIAENGLIGSGGRLLPTPGAYDGERGGSQHPDKRRAGNHSVTLQDVAEHLEPVLTPETAAGFIDWGPYAEAIARWEAVIGRPAPEPVRFDGKGGKPRLNPELTEWMMGWPAGHVTDPEIGLSRAEQLKACGNGVVPQQAAAALRMMLTLPGVPSIEAPGIENR